MSIYVILKTSFYEYMDSKKLFNKAKINQFKLYGALKKTEWVAEVKIGTKNHEQEEVIANREKFYYSREEVLNFFRDYIKMMLDSIYKGNRMKRKEQDWKY